MKKLTKEERVLRVINREEVDYLPSQVTITDRSRYGEISKALGLSSKEELDEYLENHFRFTAILQDKPMYYRDVKEELQKLNKMGFCFPDWNNNVVYDSWGLGFKVGTGTFFISFHPLQGKSNEYIAKFMPPNVPKEALFTKNLELAVNLYNPPDINMPGNFVDWDLDLKNNQDSLLLWPAGYNGTYERTYAIIGWEEFMTGIYTYPKIIKKLMDKVVEYKVNFARKVVEKGFKIAHHGDDLGMQSGPLFSKSIFKEFILPGLKEVWNVYNKANIPIMFHSCGKFEEFLPDLIDIGLKILEPVQPCNDLRFLKKEYGKDLIFMGGINTQVLPFITPQETKKMVSEVIRTLGKGGGYIIAPSTEILNDVPVLNIKAMVETIKEEREKVLYI